MDFGEAIIVVIGVAFCGYIIFVAVAHSPKAIRRWWLQRRRWSEMKAALLLPPRGTRYYTANQHAGTHGGYARASCIVCGGPMSDRWVSIVNHHGKDVRGGYLCSEPCLVRYAGDLDQRLSD